MVSQKTCVSTVDEFDDAFRELPYHHSVSNSDSGFVASRNSEERPISQSMSSNSDTRRMVPSDGIEMSDIKQSLVDLGSTITVEYETRDGTAKQGTDFEHQQGTVVREAFAIIREFLEYIALSAGTANLLFIIFIQSL